MKLTWYPGEHHALVWPDGMALVAEINSRAAVDLWEAVSQGVDLSGFIETFAQVSGRSPLALPPFAVMIRDSRDHIAVRGDLVVEVTIDGEVERLDGSGMVTWIERSAPELREVRFGSVSGEGGLPLVGGVVAAAGLRVSGGVLEDPRLLATPSISSLTQPPVVDGATDTAAPDTNPRPAESEARSSQKSPLLTLVPEPLDGSSHVDGSPTAGSGARLPAVSGSHQTVLPDEIPIAADPHEPGHQTDLAEDAANEAVDRAGVEAGDAGDESDSAESQDRPEPVTDALEFKERPHEESSGEYAALWQREYTVHHPLESAAMRPDDEDGLISSVPGRSARLPQTSNAPAEEVPPPELGDHDGMTVMQEDIGGSSSQDVPEAGEAPDLEDVPGGVLSRVCADHHSNPPHRTTCRVCSATLVGDAVRIAQPVVGRLRTSDGEVIDLTGHIVGGRNPRASRVTGPVLPRLLAIPHPHVSSSHLEVRVEGWDVIVRDLNSSNGTYLRRHGDPPVRIPEVPLTIVAGDILDLGHGVHLFFEDLG